MPPDDMIPVSQRNRIAIELTEVCKMFGPSAEKPAYAVDHLNLKIRAGEFFTFLGPSGCGKTTTLRMIAGFEDPTSGHVLLDGKDVTGVPAHQRNVNTVFQSYALFPHLSVEQNVGFGLSVKGISKAEIKDRVVSALESVNMAHAAVRKPSELSGGQQQRVALARALVNRPSVLLLDEPFGALDLKLRRQMQLEVKNMQRALGITFIFVTHDQEEALTMSDRIAVMSDGVIQQIGDPVSIYENPQNRFTAGFIGEMNMLEARVIERSGDILTLDSGGTTLRLPGPQSLAAGSTCTIAIRPEALEFGPATDNAQITFTGKVNAPVYIGTDSIYGLQLADGQMVDVRVRNGQSAVSRPSLGDLARVSCSPHAVRVLTQ
jgi:spermidine/putrescine transport system ATP-binding protein